MYTRMHTFMYIHTFNYNSIRPAKMYLLMFCVFFLYPQTSSQFKLFNSSQPNSNSSSPVMTTHTFSYHSPSSTTQVSYHWIVHDHDYCRHGNWGVNDNIWWHLLFDSFNVVVFLSQLMFIYFAVAMMITVMVVGYCSRSQ